MRAEEAVFMLLTVGICTTGQKSKTPQPPCAGRWGAVPPDSADFQSKKATEAIALDRFSVFISTRCQPSSRIVA